MIKVLNLGTLVPINGQMTKTMILNLSLNPCFVAFCPLIYLHSLI